jgi:hypothetical protein
MLDLGLSSRELMIYAMIHGICSHNQVYYGTLEHTAKWARCHKDTAGDVLASLVKKGFITKRVRAAEGKKRCFYSLAPVKEPPETGAEASESCGLPVDNPVENTTGETPIVGETPMDHRRNTYGSIGETPTDHRQNTDVYYNYNITNNTNYSEIGGCGGFLKDVDFAKAYSLIVEKWNETSYLGKERKTIAANLTVPEQEAVRKALSLYKLSEILNAIDNYIYMYERPEKFRTKLTYGNVFNFLFKALPTFADDETFTHQYFKTEKAK